MTPLIGLPDNLGAETYSGGYQSFGQMAATGIGLPDSVSTESHNSGSLTTVSAFDQWHIQNWNFLQWALILAGGWIIAELLKKRGLA